MAALFARARREARAAASSTRPITARRLAELAFLVASTSDDHRVPGVGDALRRAASALVNSPDADPDARPRAALDVVHFAEVLAQGARDKGFPGLAELAGDLEHAGYSYFVYLFESGSADDGCFSWLTRRTLWSHKKELKNNENDIEAHLLEGDNRGSLLRAFRFMLPRIRASVSTTSEDLASNIGFALFGTLALLPTLGPEGILKGQSDNFKSCFEYILVTWWSAVALGVPCTQSAPYGLKREYARFAARISMIGITGLFIIYCHLLFVQSVTQFCYIALAIAHMVFLDFVIN
uniref:Uncharacterized protein n=1 Tax=Oryza meridionalis TaxID=40149 RepID=A0A0E0CBL1_9ORYZ